MTSEGIVYMVRAKGTDHYKIGYTSQDVDKRVSSLQTGCPHELEAVATWPGTLDDESELHELLDGYRGIGEWFELTVPDLVEFSREMLAVKSTQHQYEQALLAHEEGCTTREAHLSALLRLAEVKPKHFPSADRYSSETDSVWGVIERADDYRRLWTRESWLKRCDLMNRTSFQSRLFFKWAVEQEFAKSLDNQRPPFCDKQSNWKVFEMDWISEAKAAQAMGLQVSELIEMREAGSAPKPYRKTEDCQIFYTRKIIDSWVLWRTIHASQGSDIAGLPDSAKRGDR